MCSASAPITSRDWDRTNAHPSWPVCNTWPRFTKSSVYRLWCSRVFCCSRVEHWLKVLCCVELGRKGERLWSGRVLQGSAHDCKTAHAPPLHSLGIVEWTCSSRIFTGCFCATEIPSECHNAALWVLRRARSWGQVGEKGDEQDPLWLKHFMNVVLICLCSIWTASPADQ